MGREILTIKELSAYLKIPIGTLYHFAGARRIPFFKISNLLRFDKAAIDEWLQRNSVQERETERW